MQAFTEVYQHQWELLYKHGLVLKELSQQVSEAIKSLSASPITPVNKEDGASHSAISKSKSNPFLQDESNYQMPTKSNKLEFPTFNGEDLRNWLIKVQHFFYLDLTPINCRVRVATCNLRTEPYATYFDYMVRVSYWLVNKIWVKII